MIEWRSLNLKRRGINEETSEFSHFKTKNRTYTLLTAHTFIHVRVRQAGNYNLLITVYVSSHLGIDSPACPSPWNTTDKNTSHSHDPFLRHIRLPPPTVLSHRPRLELLIKNLCDWCKREVIDSLNCSFCFAPCHLFTNCIYSGILFISWIMHANVPTPPIPWILVDCIGGVCFDKTQACTTRLKKRNLFQTAFGIHFETVAIPSPAFIIYHTSVFSLTFNGYS